MSNKSKPVDQIRINNFRAAIWSNPTEDGRVFYSITFSKSYQDKAGNWKETDSYNPNDLLVLQKVMDQAYLRVTELQNAYRKIAATQQSSQGESVNDTELAEYEAVA